MNDVIYYIDLSALLLRLLGVLVGAGLLLEYLFKQGPMKWLIQLLNWPRLKRFWLLLETIQRAFDKIFQWNIPFDWQVPTDIEGLWEKIQHKRYILIPYAALILDLIWSIGPFVWLFFMLYGFIMHGSQIPNYFWILFSILVLTLIMRNVWAACIQVDFLKKLRKEGTITSDSSWLSQFIRNWFIYPCEIIVSVMVMSLVLILILPLWVANFFRNLAGRTFNTSQSNRQLYYLGYSAVSIILSIILQIVALYMKHHQ